MTETNNTLTNEQLKEKLSASSFTDEMKQKLEGIIPSMDENERNQLIDILNREETERSTFEEEKLKKLAKLNEEFQEKVNQTEHEEGKYARENFETFDKDQNEKELANFDKEIEDTKTNRSENIASETNKLDSHSNKKPIKHTARNFLLGLIGLAVVIGGILFAISQL
jgi:type I site-specific restriction-modification system R (restriction) subunit